MLSPQRRDRGSDLAGLAQQGAPDPPFEGGGGRGRERAGPTRSHPEPGRDPAQRRRVLWGDPTGGEAAAGTPHPHGAGGPSRLSRPLPPPEHGACRGVEQRQLVGS